MLGHARHDRKVVQAQGLTYFVYDYKKYLGKSEDYCTGQDIISESLGERGVWEPCETQLIRDLLENKPSESKNVLDFGSHIGYYSILAAKAGYQVVAFDASQENLDLLDLSAEVNNLQVETRLCWLDDDVPEITLDDVHLLKADVEGAEQYVFKATKNLFEQKKVKYAIFEVSPVFNDTYPDLVENIIKLGYNGYVIPHSGNSDLNNVTFLYKLPLTEPERRSWISRLHQENILFVRGE